jgi:hypothetical protein
VQYVNKEAQNLTSRRLQALSAGEADFDLQFVPDLLIEIEKAKPIVILAGQHVGCFELFARGEVRAVRDLKHKTVAVREIGATEYLFLSVILSYVGLDPLKDISWLTPSWRRCGCLLTRRSTPSSAFPAPAAASGPEDRTRGSQQHDRPPLVAVFLLHGGRQPGLRSTAPGRDKAGRAEPHEGE